VYCFCAVRSYHRIEPIGAQDTLETSADHHRIGALLHQIVLKHVTEHGGLLDGKSKEGLSYTISPHLNTTGNVPVDVSEMQGN